MKQKAAMITLLCVAVCIFLSTASVFAGGIPEEGADGNAAGLFGIFSENAAGRYSAETDEGLAVLELSPAFGRLFASVGLYFEGSSLYSYYMAELIPVCTDDTGFCPHEHSDHSFDLHIRLFSNMSYAGSYWPGETVQRLTVMPDGILLSYMQPSGYGSYGAQKLGFEEKDWLQGYMDLIIHPDGSFENKGHTNSDIWGVSEAETAS